LTKLHTAQEGKILKPVRQLSRKMLDPTNFEKMKMSTAIRVFGNDVIAALELMNSSGHEDFQNIEATLKFMKMVKKWWEVMLVLAIL
jgi:hypothetical protein